MRRYALSIKLVLAALLLAFIWGNSFLPGELSGRESEFIRQLLQPVIAPLQRLLSAGGFEIDQSVLVRKVAHFTEFAALGAVMLALFVRPGWKIRFLLPAGLCLIAAAVDESIQMFSAGRGPSVRDAALDFGGACVGLALAAALVGLIRLIRRRKTGFS